MNYKYRDFCNIYFGQKNSSLCLKDFKESRYSLELQSLLEKSSIGQVVVLDQIHANIGLSVDEVHSLKNSSILEHQGDFLITNKKNIALVVLTADCVPLILIDPIKKIVAVVHAGWKGSFTGVLEATLETMKQIS